MKKQIYYLALEKIITLGCGFFGSIVLMRYLGPEENAIFLQFIGIAYIVSGVVKGGLDDIVQAKFTESRHQSLIAAKNIIVIRLTLVAFIIFPLSYYLNSVGAGVIEKSTMLMGGLILIQVGDLGLYYLRSVNKNNLNVIVTSAASISLAFAIVAGALSSNSLGYFVAVHILAGAMAACGFTVLALRYRKTRKDDIIYITIQPEVQITMLINAAMAAVYFRMESVFLPELIGNAEAGRYMAAQRFADLIPGTLGVVASIALPWLARADEGQQRLSLLSSLTNVTVFAAVFSSICIYFIYVNIIISFIGAEYSGSQFVLLSLLFAVPVYIQGAFIDIYFILKGASNAIFVKTAVAFVIKIILFTMVADKMPSHLIPVISFISVLGGTIISLFLYDRRLLILHVSTLNPIILMDSINLIKKATK